MDYSGQKFGFLTVMYKVGVRKSPCGANRHIWHCKCECGNECDIDISHLKYGHTKSCGCHQKRRTSETSIKQNEYEVYGGYIVVITKNGTEFMIDLDDEWVLKDYCWCVNKHGYVCARNRDDKKYIILHRLVMGCNDNMEVDHINGNPLDNRKCNLRFVTKSQNAMNHKIHSHNTSGVTGVSKHNNKWVARIYFNNELIYLGCFDNFDDAVCARKSAEEKYFGEYSYDNSRSVNEQINITFVN